MSVCFSFSVCLSTAFDEGVALPESWNITIFPPDIPMGKTPPIHLQSFNLQPVSDDSPSMMQFVTRCQGFFCMDRSEWKFVHRKNAVLTWELDFTNPMLSFPSPITKSANKNLWGNKGADTNCEDNPKVQFPFCVVVIGIWLKNNHHPTCTSKKEKN